MYNVRWKERKKERKTPEANEKMKELPQVGFEPTTLCTPDRCSYQLSYQGSPAGRVQIEHVHVVALIQKRMASG